MENHCEWVWLGIAPWEKVADTCPPETPCNPPPDDGLFIGQRVDTTCGGPP